MLLICECSYVSLIVPRGREREHEGLVCVYIFFSAKRVKPLFFSGPLECRNDTISVIFLGDEFDTHPSNRTCLCVL